MLRSLLRLFLFSAVLPILCLCFGPLDPYNPPPDKIDDTTPATGFPSGLVAWYTCNDSSSSALSDTIGKFGGQITGCTRDSGISGQALRFSGSGTLVIIRDSVVRFGTGDFTISLWVKPLMISQITDTTQYNIISNGVAKENGFTLAITRNSFSAFVGQYGTPSIDTTTPANADKWRHLAMTRSSGTVRLFVDGKNTQTYTTETDISTSNQLRFGRDASERQDRYFNGLIDEVKIFSKAWDASDVSRENQRFSH